MCPGEQAAAACDGATVLTSVRPVVRAIGFWSAVCLPWVALGFVATGTVTSQPLWFSAVVLGAGIAAVLGREHPIE